MCPQVTFPELPTGAKVRSLLRHAAVLTVERCVEGGQSFGAAEWRVCFLFGRAIPQISPRSLQRWRARFQLGGVAALDDGRAGRNRRESSPPLNPAEVQLNGLTDDASRGERVGSRHEEVQQRKPNSSDKNERRCHRHKFRLSRFPCPRLPNFAYSASGRWTLSRHGRAIRTPGRANSGFCKGYLADSPAKISVRSFSRYPEGRFDCNFTLAGSPCRAGPKT